MALPVELPLQNTLVCADITAEILVTWVLIVVEVTSVNDVDALRTLIQSTIVDVPEASVTLILIYRIGEAKVVERDPFVTNVPVV